MQPYFRFLVVLLLGASPVMAGEGSWTHVPFQTTPTALLNLVATPDPAIWYWLGSPADLRSEDGGRTWVKMETDAQSLRLFADRVDPATLYVTTYRDLLRSTDGGRSFASSLHLPEAGAFLEVLVSRTAGQVYAYRANNLWRSTDGGVSFAAVGNLPGNLPPRLLREAVDGDLYLMTADSCGYHHCGYGLELFRSQDQGRSWQSFWSGESIPGFNQLVLHPTRPESLYLVRSEGNGTPHLWRSDDRGASFRDVGTAPANLVTDPTRPEALFSPGVISNLRSFDGGATWETLPSPMAGGIWRDPVALVAGGKIRLFAMPGSAFFESTDFGSTWSVVPVGGFFPGGEGSRLSSGPSPGSFYFSDGNIYSSDPQPRLARSADGGASWSFSELPEGARFLAADPRVSGRLFAYTPSALLRSSDDGASFVPTSLDGLADLESSALYTYRDATALVMAAGGWLVASADNGDSWTRLAPLPAEFGQRAWRRVAADAGVAYAVNNYTELYRSLDGGATWEPRSVGHFEVRAGGGILAAVDPYSNSIDISRDGGATWQPQPVAFPLWPFDAEKSFYVDARGSFYLVGPEQMLLRSRDRGLTWQALTQDLPSYAGQPELAASRYDSDQLLLATLGGVYHGHFADQEALALGGGRFEARLRWRDARGGSGVGIPASLTDDSGIFRLFSPERSEVALRLDDGRPINGHFWISVASQTDVGLDLEVVDRLNGERWTYHSNSGEQASRRDQEAFPRGAAQPTGGVQRPPLLGLYDSQPVVTLAGRFEISISWQGVGELQVAQGRQLLGETAAFSLFAPTVVDVLVNILDGRAINGKFWIYAASLTDTEYLLHVRDRATGVVKTHHHPAGALDSFSDLGLF